MYEYDLNGNLTKDSRKGLEYKYNRLNLLEEVWKDGEMKAQYNYLADGTKVSVRDGSGKNGYDYVGSVVYKVVGGRREFGRAVVGDVHFTAKGVRYALTDQLGSVRALIDEDGNVVQQNDYYPFGAKIARDDYVNADDNRFLFSGKESQELLDLNAYDFGARMYDASLGRWNTVDPLGEKYVNLSPYNYCVNNPLVYVDPNGEDAMISIVGNTITITVDIIIYGALATDDLAELYLLNIKATWGLLDTYIFEGLEYMLDWRISVKAIQEELSEDDFRFDGKTNYMKVIEDGNSSFVVNSHKGEIRVPRTSKDNAMGHEFGHMIGMKDKYVEEKGSPISPEWNYNIMHDIIGAADEKNLDILLNNPLRAHYWNEQLNRSFISPTIKSIYHINKINREQ